jgi:hypothetical protein
MRKTLLRLAIISCIVLAYSMVGAVSGSLATNVTTNGGCEGAYFDVTALNEDITITGFDTNFVGSGPVSVYYKVGAHAGSEMNAGAWTLLGSQSVAGNTGVNQASVTLNVGGLIIPAGETYGFLVYSGRIGATTNYATRYQTFATADVQNADIHIRTGSGECGGDWMIPFDGFNAERAWDGRVYYGDTPTDGRINRYDMAAPFFAYPHIDADAGQGLVFYDGYAPGLLLEVTAGQIAAVPEFPAVNTLIAASADGRVSLYRLMDGQFQAMGPAANGKTYVMIFRGIDPYADYRSYETD